MDKPAKILLGGATCAAIIAAVGFANTHRLESKLRNLEAECVEEGKRDKLESGRFTLLCDAESLVDLERNPEPSVGIQARVVAAKREVWDSER